MVFTSTLSDSSPYFLLPETLHSPDCLKFSSTVCSMDAAGLHIRLPYDKLSGSAQILGSWILAAALGILHQNGCQAWSLACRSKPSWPLGANLVHVREVSQPISYSGLISAWDEVPQALNSHIATAGSTVSSKPRVNHHRNHESSLCMRDGDWDLREKQRGGTKYRGESGMG